MKIASEYPTRVSILASIILAAFSLALGYASGGFWPEAGLSLALGLVWLAGQGRGWRRLDSPAFLSMVTLAALGAWRGVSAWWLLFGLMAALAAWDATHFEQRLQRANYIAGKAALQQAHWRQLFIVLAAGLLLGGLALSRPIDLNLGWAIFLGLLIVIGLGRVIGAIRREEGG